VVSIAYRLGALGWLVTDTLNGNFGIKDQRMAIQWVVNNIQNFGGNPNEITLFGESAGAGSIGVHLMSNASRGLFQRAIMESNPLGLPFKTLDIATEYGDKLCGMLGCPPDNMECLRNIPPDSIVEIQDTIFVIPDPFRNDLLDVALMWAPVIDNDEVFYQPVEGFALGYFDRDVPVIIGTNANEAVAFVYSIMSQIIGKGPMDWEKYDLFLSAIYQEDFITVKNMYPCDVDDCREPLSQLFTDYMFTCVSRNVAFSIMNHTQAELHLYNFNHSLSFPFWGSNYSFCDPYTCHGAELPFVFHSAEAMGFEFTSQEENLSNAMIAYWTNFAKTGNPNSGAPVPVQWPVLTRSDRNIEFATPQITPQQYFDETFCDLWDYLGYNF